MATVNDRVTVGKGKTVWVVHELWTSPSGEALATLIAVEGYSGTTVAVDRLTVLERSS